MNKALIILASLLGAFSASASVPNKGATTLKTIVTCQQDDGDQWVEIGIVLNDGPGYKAYVVTHNEDDNSAKLISSRQVSVSKANGQVTYQDKLHTVRLVISQKLVGLRGELVVLQDGPGSLNERGLICYQKSQISFDK